jgi:hypothetical protein
MMSRYYLKYKNDVTSFVSLLARQGCWVWLEDEWNDGLSPEFLVLVTIGLEVTSVLFQSPVRHLKETNQSEKVREGDLSHDRESHPRQHLECVVWARDVVKEEARWNWAFGARWTKVP